VVNIVKRLREELQVNTTCGALNVSFGLPNRNGLNAAFLAMAIGAGMTSAITNPLHTEMIQAIAGADVMMGNGPDCCQWIQMHRESGTINVPVRGDGRTGRRRRLAV